MRVAKKRKYFCKKAYQRRKKGHTEHKENKKIM